MTRPNRLMVVDLPALMYRSCFSPGKRLTSPSGKPTRGIQRILQTLLPLIDRNKPQYLILADDAPRKLLWRRSEFPAYKEKRDELPPEPDLWEQIKTIRVLLAGMGMPIVLVPENEADDVIATVVDICAGPEVHVQIVGADKDLHQLVGPHVTMVDVIKDVEIDEQYVRTKWKVEPWQVVHVQALMGDTTDNVPGAPGIGEKTAIKLIREYGTIWDVLMRRDELKPGVQKSLANWDYQMMLRLVTLNRNCEIPLDIPDIEHNGYDLHAVRALLIELGFTTWV